MNTNHNNDPNIEDVPFKKQVELAIEIQSRFKAFWDYHYPKLQAEIESKDIPTKFVKQVAEIFFEEGYADSTETWINKLSTLLNALKT